MEIWRGSAPCSSLSLNIPFLHLVEFLAIYNGNVIIVQGRGIDI